jgi:FdhD protein
MIESEIEKFNISQINEDIRKDADVIVAREYPITIILNGQELVTMLGSPKEFDYLAIGYLSSEGFLKSKDQIKNIMVDEVRGIVRVDTNVEVQSVQDVVFKRLITSGCGRGASFYSAVDVQSQKVTSEIKFGSAELFDLVMKFQHSSELYLATHGVHSAALCDSNNILVASDDIGRHNAIDRVLGRCILEDITTKDKIILTTGRCSSEILHKVARAGIPVLVTVSVPTNLGIKIADSLGITLVGSVRGKRHMNIYTNSQRII